MRSEGGGRGGGTLSFNSEVFYLILLNVVVKERRKGERKGKEDGSTPGNFDGLCTLNS